MPDPMRDLIIFLPGITGSVLQKNGVDVWGASVQSVWNTIKTRGAALRELRPPSDGSADAVRATRLISIPYFVAGLIKGDGYSTISKAIRDSFDVIPGNLEDNAPANYFEFPYDWRYDNRIAAAQLKEVVERKLDAWHVEQGHSEAKVILIAHSMGGLVARYYLEVLEGWRVCKMLLTLGTPFQGAIKPLNFLASSYQVAGFDITDVLRACPSVYQLVSTSRIVKAGDGYCFARDLTELPNVDMTLVRQGFEFHQEIRAALEANKHNSDYANAVAIVPFVGTHQPTFQSVELLGDSLKPSDDLPADMLPPGISVLASTGDGSVPYLSALPRELSSHGIGRYYAEKHGFLQTNLDIWAQVRQVLRNSQIRIDPDMLGPGDASDAGIGINDLQDVYASDERVTFSARLMQVAHDPQSVCAQVRPILDHESSEQSQSDAVSPPPIILEVAKEGIWRFQLPELLPGMYSLEVYATGYGANGPTPIHDLFAVVE